MLLFDPSPGQILDRINILFMKIEKSAACNGPGTAALALEVAHCQRAMIDHHSRVRVDLHRLVALDNDLKALLRLQWNYEDEIRRALKDLPADKPYGALFNIWWLEQARMTGNNERARLVQEIDILFGLPPEPKFYA